MKQLSCGGIIIHNNKILACKSTGQTQYNFPKGKIEFGETPLQAAVRLIKELTNIDIPIYNDMQDDPGDICCLDLGVHKYLRTKDLHLFLFILENIPEDIKCNSHFITKKHNILPLIDDYKWVTYSLLYLIVTPKIQLILDLVSTTINEYLN